MKFNIHTIPKEGLNRRVSVTKEWFDAQLPEEEHREFFVDDIVFEYRVEKIRNNKITVHGTIRTRLTLECCRCLSEFSYPAEAEFRYVFYPARDESQWERDLTKEELDYCSYSGDTIDLSSAVVEQIVLQVPIKPVCGENCKGLCPLCGANMNITMCNHGEVRKENPFDALRTIKIKKGS